ncbi:protein adenylyltransferase SelO [Mycobacterium sp. 1274756.6]|uniref:protein adenylyltransferase SelO n=1 Tax=Mycobacterium sp. 1274756.6 TaxID=1834076 RepID=UPI000801540B|nr:YdiU family protein [Mycobacterium sp. 1274756.6]OBJ71050.1 hypothetical protein A5643_08910 [Mycobacterium sp. 1274756.6]
MGAGELGAATTVALDNRFARELPELAVPWQATPAPNPKALVLNAPLATELGLDPAWLTTPAGTGLLVGTTVPDGATPVAQIYSGHQFGGYVPRLGDGRALLLGEFPDGRDLHLKGSGPTPFARGGDGLAAVGPMLREYVISEALHALGVPTTRALAVTATGGIVHRESTLPGAVLARVAASHLRVGSFQYAAAYDHHRPEAEVVRRLADHAIARHYPDAAGADNPYRELFSAVVAAQAALVARWMLVGFIHGVMNTDNMTISGQTIDYGPCAFMEAYDPATVFSSIDMAGRYAYGNQPGIAQWNLSRFAETLLPLLAEDTEQAVDWAVGILEGFPDLYEKTWSAGMRAKLGLPEDLPASEAASLIEDLLALLQRNHRDYTSFFRSLAAVARGSAGADRAAFTDPDSFGPWFTRWAALRPDPAAMDRVNPIYIPRNHLVEQALTAATAGDLGPVEKLLEAVRFPYEPRAGLEVYAEPAPAEFGPYQTFCGT